MKKRLKVTLWLLSLLFSICSDLEGADIKRTPSPFILSENVFELSPGQHSLILVDKTQKMTSDHVLKLLNTFSFLPYKKTEIPTRFNSGNRTTWIYFNLYNSGSHTSHVLFTGSIENDSIFIFRKGKTIEKDLICHDSGKTFTLPVAAYNTYETWISPYDTIGILFKQKVFVYDKSTLFPKISNAESYLKNYILHKNPLFLFYLSSFFLILGIFLVVLIHYFYFENKIILLYCIYLLSVMFAVWRSVEGNSLTLDFINKTFPWFTWKIVQTGAIFLSYSFFVFSFLEFKPKFSKIFLRIIVVLVVIAAIIEIPSLYYFPDISYMVYYTTRMIISLMGLISVYLLWKTNHPFSRYVFIGTSFLIIGEIVSNFVAYPWSSLIPTIGVLIEVIIFTAIIAIWSHQKHIEINQNIFAAQQEILSKKDTIARMRKDFAQEIHDELGSTVAKLNLAVYYNLKKSQHPEDDFLNKIMSNLNKLSNQIKEMIWLFDEGKSTLADLVSEIRQVCNEYINEELSIRYDIPEIEDKTLTLSLDSKRNIMAIIKEAMTNIVKHSFAKEIFLTCLLTESQLHLIIKDDGNGFSVDDQNPIGHGMTNMKYRVERLNGTIRFESDRSGTHIMIQVPLTSLSQ